MNSAQWETQIKTVFCVEWRMAHSCINALLSEKQNQPNPGEFSSIKMTLIEPFLLEWLFPSVKAFHYTPILWVSTVVYNCLTAWYVFTENEEKNNCISMTIEGQNSGLSFNFEEYVNSFMYIYIYIHTHIYIPRQWWWKRWILAARPPGSCIHVYIYIYITLP